jgi:hypothetical protein
LGIPLTQSIRHMRSWPQASSFVVKWRWRTLCARQILLGKNGSLRHKDWPGWHCAKGRSRSTHNFLWEAPWRGSQLCSQSDSCT